MATDLTLDTINNANLKTIGEAGAFAVAQLFQNQVSHGKRMDQLAEMFMGRLLSDSNAVDPAEAVSTAKLFKGESDSAVLSLLTQLAGGSVGAKIAQSTPGDLSVEMSKLQNTVSSLTAQMGFITAAIQQMAKNAVNTPPETGK
jgi:hypothetical protein